MFNNSHFLLFYFFSYYSFVVCFLFKFLFIYIISFFYLVLVSLFRFDIIIAWHVFFYCISFMFVFIVLLFLYSYYLFLLSFAFCFFSFPLISWFLLVLLNIIPLFTIHQTNWIVSYHIDSIIKRKYVGICFDSLCFLSVSLWFIYPLISFTISILANNRINHVHRFETIIQILQIIVK